MFMAYFCARNNANRSRCVQSFYSSSNIDFACIDNNAKDRDERETVPLAPI